MYAIRSYYGDQQTTETPEDLGDVEAITEEVCAEENAAEALQEKLAASQDQLMRVAAEFENYKKRMERERSKLLKYAGESVLRDLLSTIDNLDP